MPGKAERHARSGWEWGPNPARSAMIRDEVAEQSAAGIERSAKRAPSRKDTRSWCKGKEGREHKPGIACRPPTPFDHTCEWRARWSDDGVAWRCHHQEECSACGKVLRTSWQIAPGECPDYPGSVEQRAEAEREAAEATDRWLTRRRRHVIDGPQGYRRKRETT